MHTQGCLSPTCSCEYVYKVDESYTIHINPNCENEKNEKILLDYARPKPFSIHYII